MALMMDLAVLFSGLNTLVLAGLIYIYARIVQRTHSAYTGGMLFFATFLLTQNLLTAYAYTSMPSFFGEAILPYLFGISLLEFAGLTALLRTTL